LCPVGLLLGYQTKQDKTDPLVRRNDYNILLRQYALKRQLRRSELRTDDITKKIINELA
jgi:hypothetical protein